MADVQHQSLEVNCKLYSYHLQIFELSTFNLQPKYEFRAAWIATVSKHGLALKKGFAC